MRIRTKLELKDFLDKDLAWRKQELSSILASVNSAQSKALNVALRTSILLLYAHWEGFIKNAATAYVNFVSNQNLILSELHNSFLAIALKQKITLFEETNTSTIHAEFIHYFRNNLVDQAKIKPENVISSKSNLNSKILKQILVAIGIDYTSFELKANLIDEKLLHYRNNVAHGEFL